MKNKYYSENYLAEEAEPDTIEVSGAGGGGCFPKGTLVRTPGGWRCIDRMKVGEPVVSYDKFGNLSEGRVVETLQHASGTFPDSLFFVYSKEVSLFPEGITGNHAVFDPTTKEHKEIVNFKVGDSLAVLDGSLKVITEIREVKDPLLDVYNLIIQPQHTYIAGLGVRVHNGGGGKDSGSRQAVESENTLQSSAIAKVLEVYSHGEVEGIVGGLKGVTFNNTQVENSTGEANFPKVTFEERKGLPSQEVIEGFEEVEREIGVAGIILISGSPVTEQLPAANVSSVRVTLRLPEGLWKHNLANGDVLGHSVSYTIQTRSVTPSGTFSTVLTKTITDKTTSPWEVAHRITKPVGAIHWEIRVTKTSPEDAGSHLKSVLQWVRLTEIIGSLETYNNIAYVGITLPASATGNRVPVRAYHVKGIKVQIPINYDPLLKTYGGGYWNGAFKTAWTDNPAWILYDLVTNQEYGLQNFLNHVVDADIYAFFEAALYCDCASWDGTNYNYALLDDGQQGLEVRFRFNAVISTQQDAWQLLHAVASNMRAIMVTAGDQISIIQDRPKTSSKIFNNTNVIDGLFVYSGTEALSRATTVNCTFNDKNDRYLPRTISEEDDAAILRYGHSVKDIISYGCTSESQARRAAKHALITETSQHDLVSFNVALNIIDVVVGQVVSVMDTDYISDNNQYLSGRVISVTGNTVILGNEVELLSGYIYTLGIASVDYSYIEEAFLVTAAGVTDTLTTVTPLPAGDYTNHEFFCFSSGNANQSARDFQIMNITESDRGVYAISGVFYFPEKFGAIEQGIVVPDRIYSNLVATVLPKVTAISFEEFFTNTGVASENFIDVRWEWDSLDPQPDGSVIDRLREVTFSLRWRRDSGRFTIVNDIPTKSFQIPSIIPGVYEVIIDVQNLQGKRSLANSAVYNYRTVGAASTLLPPDNFYVADTPSTEFTGTHIALTWLFPQANETKTDTLLDYILEVYDLTGASLKKTHIISPDEAKNGSFNYTFQLNSTDFNPAVREVQFKLYSRDMVGERSVALVKNFTNPVPLAPTFSIVSGSEAAYIKIVASSDTDIAGYEIHRELQSNSPFTPSALTLQARGLDTYVALKGNSSTAYTYRVGAFDSFGSSGMVYSTEQGSTMLSAGDVSVWVFDGLLFKPNAPATNRVSWTAGSASVDGTTPITINAGDSSTPWTSGIQYFYYDGSSNTISVTSDLGIAVTGAMVLATYKGGTSLVVGNGDAFTDGGLILANTVGANQLVVDSAVITNTAQLQNAIIQSVHIDDGQVTNAKIGNIIRSTNYSNTLFTGWQLDKAGNIVTYGSLEVRDNNGDLIAQIGGDIEWEDIFDTNGTKPSNNADVTGSNVALSVQNQTSFATLDKITALNISSYIESLAVTRAYIADLAVSEAKIDNLAVSTLKIKNNAVSIPEGVAASNTVNMWTATINIIALSVTNDHHEPVDFIITYGASVRINKAGWATAVISGKLLSTIGNLGSSLWGVGYDRTEVAVGVIANKVTIPGNATFTFTGQITADGAASATYSNRYITAIGLKK